MKHEFREDGSHYNGGTKFFGYGYRALGEPRLNMIRRWYRQGDKKGTTEDRFHVDGAYVESYDAALKALETPPIFSVEEREALRIIGDTPADWRRKIDVLLLHKLGCKGAIAWGPPGQCHRTMLGRSVVVP